MTRGHAESEGPSPAVGMSAAVGAALAGMLAWYGLTVLTGYEIGWASWVVGALVGFVTLTAARGPDRRMGALAATCSALAILGGGYLAVSHSQAVRLSKEADKIYGKMLALAPRVSAAQTEDEIRQVIAELNCEDDADKPNLAAVSEDQMLSFDNETRPRYRGVLDGKPTRGRFVSDFVAGHGQPKTAILEESLTAWTLLWVILGSSAAFIIASGLGRSEGEEHRPGTGKRGPGMGARGGFTRSAKR